MSIPKKLDPVLLAVFCASFTLPFLVSHYPPLVDYPEHVAEVSILAHWSDPNLGFSKTYQITNWLHPYMAHRLLLVLPARLFGAEFAYRLYLLLSLLAIPIIIFKLSRSIGAPPHTTWLVFPFLYSFPLFFGFVSYITGTALVLGGYLWLETRSHASHPSDTLILSSFSAIVFLAHPHAFLYWLVTAPVLAYLLRPTWRSIVHTCISMTPGLALFAFYGVRSTNLQRVASGHLLFLPPLQRLLSLPSEIGGFWTDPTFFILGLLLIFFGLLAFLLPTPPAPRLATTVRESFFQHRYLVLFLCYLAGSFASPFQAGRQAYVVSRFPSMALLLLPLALGHWRALRHRASRYVLGAFTTAFAVFFFFQMLLISLETKPLDRIIASIPKGASVRCQIEDNRSDYLMLPVYRHFCGYILAARGGLNGFLFKYLGIDYRPETGFTPDQRALYAWQDHPTVRFPYQKYGDLFDYWVVRSRHERTAYDPGGPLAQHFEPLLRVGLWRLYRRVQPFAPRQAPNRSPAPPPAPPHPSTHPTEAPKAAASFDDSPK